jgi:hypothetical protein
MSSIRQIEANRRNAFKSTGPITPEGKQRSRCNAVRHGLTAETVIGSLENSEDYEGFEAAVISDYNPESSVERELVLRLASVLWRLRRSTSIETTLFDSTTVEPDLNAPKGLANRFLYLAALPTFPLDRLSRYESMLWRQARQIVFTVRSLRRNNRDRSRSSFPFLFGR